jgi:hypothetical protein
MQRLLFFLLVGALPAAGQWRHLGQSYFEHLEPTGFVGIGGSTAVNPLARNLDAGWNFAGGFGVTQGYTGVMADFMFTDFGITHSALVRQDARSGYQRFWALTVDPIVHVNPRGPVDFYLVAGAGLYGQRTGLRAASGLAGQASQFDLVRVDTTHDFGVNGGAGFAFSIRPESRVKVFAEARFHRIFNEGSRASLIPITVGVRF